MSRSPPPAPSPAERLVRIIDGLCAAIAARGPGGWFTAPLLVLLWSRLRRTAARAVLVAARIAAGLPHPVTRPRAPRPARPQPLRLPRGHAWLVRLVPGAAAFGSQLQALLADPLMAPLAGAPGLRRMLNPLCRMLGIAKPPPPSPPSPRPAAAPPAPSGDRAGDTPAASRPPPAAPLAA